MPRPKLIDRRVRVETQIPESILAKVHLELYSDLEARVPHGKMSELLTQLLSRWLTDRGVN